MNKRELLFIYDVSTDEKWSMFSLKENSTFEIVQMRGILEKIEENVLYKMAYLAFWDDKIYKNDTI